jgi:flagellar hook-associated protein 2
MGMDISGLTGGGSASLNDEMIAKLRAEDEKVTVAPAEKRLEDWEKGSVAYDNVKAQVTALESSLYAFSQANINNNVFDSVTENHTGTSVDYDFLSSKQEEGIHNISINAVAKRDVWQSDAFSIDSKPGAGTLTISGIDFTTTDSTTYEELANEINNNKDLNATLTKVGDDSYRLVVKSAETGISNTLSISGLDLGFNDDSNHVQVASNLEAVVDGVSYNTSSNTIELSDSLHIIAKQTGDSSISIQANPNAIIDAINNFVDTYNTLAETINNESRYNSETEESGSLQNSSEIRNMLSSIKEKLFGSYGDDIGEKHNVFGFGFELDRYGKLSVDQDVLSQKVSQSPDDVRELFTGTPENKGLMEDLYKYIDDLESSNGLLSLYEKGMANDKTSLEESKDKAIADLDAKYARMKTQFSRYSVIISQMESSFASLKYQIAESTASK